MMDKGDKMFWFIRMILFAILFILGMGFIVMLLWNWLIPEITGWKSITFIEALGLFVLCKILFGFGGGGSGQGWRGGHRHQKHWKHKMRQKWDQMSDDEKADFKAKMKDKWKKC